MKGAEGRGMNRLTGLAVVAVLSGAALTATVQAGHVESTGRPPGSTAGSTAGPALEPWPGGWGGHLAHGRDARDGRAPVLSSPTGQG
ncbi:hypothetical protein GCM10010232_55510 [Streptomyces amakusaensis]|uniref:Secreted protein n=1 Tax=Streptomyces amakusaensis TaxID=67271 RepID=A0ABW0ANH0_9ACTN